MIYPRHLPRPLSRRPRLLFRLFLAALVVANVLLAFTEDVPFLGRVAGLALPVSLFWHTMSWVKNPGRGLWIHFWVVFLNAFQLVLLSLWGKGIIAVDMFLNLMNTNSNEAGELLGSIMLGVVPVVVFYLCVLTLATLAWRHGTELPTAFQTCQRRRSAVALAASVALTLLAAVVEAPRFRVSEHVFPLNVTYNAGLAVKRAIQVERYAHTSQAYSVEARCLQPDTTRQVCVYVIGETARAANFQLYGYPRPTTPHLMERRHELAIFSDALSQSNTTHKSVPMLLSEADAHSASRIHTIKSVFEPFRQAGFHTAFISSQRLNRDSYIGYFAHQAHSTHYLHEADTSSTWDEDLLPALSRELHRSEAKKFVVLHTYGSHFRYFQRYPRHMAHFLPDSSRSLSPHWRQPMLNAYDNSIRYTDHILHQVIDSVAATGAQATVVYLSDHGEDLYDDHRQLFLHASLWPSYYQLHVPLVIWASTAWRQAHPQSWAALQANSPKPVSTSLAAYHTLLHLSHITCNRLDTTASLASPNFEARPRYYLDDRSAPRPIPACGMDEADEALFHHYGLDYR